MPKKTRITNSIRALRFAAGEMTQAELAEKVGLTRQTIIAIEQGRYSPSLEVAFKVPILEVGVPTLLVLNMADELDRRGGHIDEAKLADELGVDIGDPTKWTNDDFIAMGKELKAAGAESPDPALLAAEAHAFSEAHPGTTPAEAQARQMAMTVWDELRTRPEPD